MRARKRVWLAVLLLATVLATVVGPCAFVGVMAAGRIDRVSAADSSPVALVLGASVHRDGTPSPALKARLDTAYELYHQGKVKVILVSGDNSSADYNEPGAMRKYLAGRGVPSSKIVSDFAGRSTYDSCYRAQAIFGVSQLIVVSQDYHLPRAVATCRALGIDATGVSEPTTGPLKAWVRGAVREVPASVKLTTELLTSCEPLLGQREDAVALALTDPS